MGMGLSLKHISDISDHKGLYMEHTKDPKGQEIKTVGQLFKEYWHLRKIKKFLISSNYVDQDVIRFTGCRSGLISDCGEYMDVWSYDEDGEPLKESTFLNRLVELGFSRHDWIHSYEFKNVYVGDGKYLLIDYHIHWSDLLTIIGVIKKHQQSISKEAV